MDDYCYYIVGDLYIKGRKISDCRYIIFKKRCNLPITIYNSDELDGPYVTLNALKKYSPLVKNMLSKHKQKHLDKIFKPENIRELKDEILVAKDKQFPLDFVDVFEHGLKGGEKAGGHFYDPEKIKIVQQLSVDKNGVIEAYIETFDWEKKSWIPKKNITTIFPKHWTLQKYTDELIKAYKEKVKIEGRKFAYGSVTTCGINTELIIINGKMKSFYPKQSKSEIHNMK